MAAQRAALALAKEARRRARICFGDYCDFKPKDGGTAQDKSSMHDIAKREIFLDRAGMRKWEYEQKRNGNKVGSKNLEMEAARRHRLGPDQYCESKEQEEESEHKRLQELSKTTEGDLMTWFTPQEEQRQLDNARVCDTCHKIYTHAAQLRAKSEALREKIASEKDAKARQACLRLYERFAHDERKRKAEMLQLMQAHEEQSKNPPKAKRTRKVRRTRKKSSKLVDVSDTASVVSRSSQGSKATAFSTFSTLSFAAGDRVSDALLGHGTIIDSYDESSLVRYDDGPVETTSTERLCHIDRQVKKNYFRLSADELIGVGTLPPGEYGGEQSSPQNHLANGEHQGDIFLDPSSDGGILSPRFKEIFEARAIAEAAEELEMESEISAERARHTRQAEESGTLGVLCPFGCGQRLQSTSSSLSGSHAAWLKHMSQCPNKAEAQDNVHSLPTLRKRKKATAMSLGIRAVQNKVSDLDLYTSN